MSSQLCKMTPLFSTIMEPNACHLNGSEYSSSNEFARKWQEDYGTKYLVFSPLVQNERNVY